MDPHDITGAKLLVRLLCEKGLQWYRVGERSKSWSQTLNTIASTFSIYQSEEAVEGVFLRPKAHGNRLVGEIDGPHILLKPPSSNQHVVCLLGIRWALDDATKEMTLYLHMFGESQVSGKKAWHRGYRLELPHATGSHNYTHVQPIKSVGWNSRAPILFEDQSVPDSFPTFPLRGHNLTTLCAALAVGLHGIDVLPQIVDRLKGTRFQTIVRNLFVD